MSSLQEKKAWLGWHAGQFLEYSFTSSHSIFHITHRSPGNLQVLSVTIHEHSVNSDGGSAGWEGSSLLLAQVTREQQLHQVTSFKGETLVAKIVKTLILYMNIVSCYISLESDLMQNEINCTEISIYYQKLWLFNQKIKNTTAIWHKK